MLRRALCVAVIGAAAASDEELHWAAEIGAGIALRGLTLVCGGLGGVMAAASRGAAQHDGCVVGILPGADARGANPHLTVPIVTNMGHARNVIIAHTADVLVAIGGREGTLSEMAIGLKLEKPVIALRSWQFSDAIIAVDSVDAALIALDTCLSSLAG